MSRFSKILGSILSLVWTIGGTLLCYISYPPQAEILICAYAFTCVTVSVWLVVYFQVFSDNCWIYLLHLRRGQLYIKWCCLMWKWHLHYRFSMFLRMLMQTTLSGVIKHHVREFIPVQNACTWGWGEKPERGGVANSMCAFVIAMPLII